jgi:hypothetical protein
MTRPTLTSLSGFASVLATRFRRGRVASPLAGARASLGVLALALGVLLAIAPAAHAQERTLRDSVTSGEAVEPAPGPPVKPIDHSAFDAILKANVRDGLIDYANIRARWRPQLASYLDHLADVDPITNIHSLDERLAFYLNAYNATMIRAVVDSSANGWHPSDDGFAVFHAPLVRMGKRTLSLDQLEERIKRTSYDPRIYVALVSASRSSPPMPARAYHGADLEGMLDRDLEAFIRDPSRNHIDHAAKKVELAPLFKKHADEFLPMGGVLRAVSAALGRDVSTYSVSYLPEDWSLNSAPAVKAAPKK